MSEKDKKSEKKKDKKDVPNPIEVSFTVKGFPIDKFREWKRDCEIHFNDCYWFKIWNDHQATRILKAKQEAIVLKEYMENQQQQQEPEDEGVACIGGNKIK